MSASKPRTTSATSNRTPRCSPHRPTPQCALNAAMTSSCVILLWSRSLRAGIPGPRSFAAPGQFAALRFAHGIVCRASDADALGEQLAVVRRVAEVDLGALGALEVQVRRVLP